MSIMTILLNLPSWDPIDKKLPREDMNFRRGPTIPKHANDTRSLTKPVSHW